MKFKIKKGQAWGLDLMIAVMIFTAGISAFYFYSLNYSQNQGETMKQMTDEGNFIAESIFSEGYPENWTADNVEKLGILSSGKINETKLEIFYSLASGDYSRTRELFRTKFNYYFLSDENFTINSSEVEGIGKKPDNAENLIKVTRLAAYRDKPINIYIYVWSEE